MLAYVDAVCSGKAIGHDVAADRIANQQECRVDIEEQKHWRR